MSELYVPEISYANTDPETIASDVLSVVETHLGRDLAIADPLRLFALALASQNVILRNLLDEAGRQNLLAYAGDEYLDALGDLIGVARLTAASATTTLRFSSAAPAESAITIPAGTRATPGDQIYFATDYVAVIPAGSSYVDVPATCVDTGTSGNGFIAGEIDRMVDPIANVSTVSNMTESRGGYETEEDEAFRLRIRLGVTQFSVAGSRDAYEYWARSASAQVFDVYVESPTPGEVDVYILALDGELPDQDLLDTVQAVLSADTVRPLTDLVTVKAPTAADYELDVTYYIHSQDAARAAEIQTAVEAAVEEWILWQKSAIGRDVNPSELIARMMNAGAKRVVITSPSYTAVDATEVPSLDGDPVIDYGGLEDE